MQSCGDKSWDLSCCFTHFHGTLSCALRRNLHYKLCGNGAVWDNPPLKVVRSLEAVLDFFLIKAEAQQVSFTMMQWTLRSCDLCWMCLLGETGPSPWTNQDAWPKCCSASLHDDELNNENVTVFFFSLTVFLEILTPFFRWSHKIKTAVCSQSAIGTAT